MSVQSPASDRPARTWLIGIAGILALTALFFSDFFIGGSLPVTSADSALVYHNRVESGEWLRQGVLPQWRPGAGVGRSAFSSTVAYTAYHAAAAVFAVVSDPRIAQVLFVALHVLLVLGGTSWLLVRRFGVPVPVALMGAATLVFTPGLLNEYLFSLSGGFGLLPLLVCVVDQVRGGPSRRNVVLLAVLLQLTYVTAHIAVVQFSLIFLACYLLYMAWPALKQHRFREVSGVMGGFAGGVLLFMGLSAVFLLPFAWELVAGDRSHLYDITSSIPLTKWLLPLHLPFTSWIFIDEKMLTTGLLTQLETLPRYSQVLLLPSLLLFVAHRQAFSRAERFFFLFTTAFMVATVANRYVPIMGLLVQLTRSTGWHRATPVYFFSAAVCLALVTGKLVRGTLGTPDTRWARRVLVGYRAHITTMGVGYTLATLVVVGGLVAVGPLGWQGVYGVLGLVSSRSSDHLAFYLDHFLTFPRVLYLLMVPTGLAACLWAFEWIRRRGQATVAATGLLVVAVVGSQFALTKLYYPFNRGVDQVRALPSARRFADTMATERVAVVFNSQVDVERLLIDQHRLPEDTANPQLHLLARRYPEFSRFQSDITMHGSFFNTIGAAAYTRGMNITPPRMSRWHEAVLADNPTLREVWARQKGYLRIGPGDVTSPLLDTAAVTHILSSMPLEDPTLRLESRGDAYHIYENLEAAPRLVWTTRVREVGDGDAALAAVRGPGFDARREVVVERPLSTPLTAVADATATVRLDEFAPNRVQVTLTAASAGVLVYNDAYHAGWSATLDDAPTAIHRANYLFKAVEVPAGTHRIVFSYRAPGFALGVGLAAATALLALGLVLWRR